MKGTLILSACFLALGIAALAQGDSDYQKWMKTVGATSGSLRKNLEAKNGPGAAGDAKKLEEVFGQIHNFWNSKGVNDAMMSAMTARGAFGEVAEDASAGKFDEASGALKKASATCGACHAAHREKAADGSWKIK